MEVIKIQTINMDQNVYIYFDKETKEGVIIDPGSMSENIIDIINKYNININAILLTHGHFDHIGAVKEIKEQTGASVYSHKLEKELLGNPNLNLSLGMGRTEISLNVDKFFAHGDIFNFGEVALEIIHTPGHTPGGVCYYDRKNSILFTGDSLFKNSIGRTDFPRGSHEDLINSIKNRIFTLLDSTKVYPGHGENTTILEEKESNPFFA